MKRILLSLTTVLFASVRVAIAGGEPTTVEQWFDQAWKLAANAPDRYPIAVTFDFEERSYISGAQLDAMRTKAERAPEGRPAADYQSVKRLVDTPVDRISKRLWWSNNAWRSSTEMSGSMASILPFHDTASNSTIEWSRGGEAELFLLSKGKAPPAGRDQSTAFRFETGWGWAFVTGGLSLIGPERYGLSAPLLASIEANRWNAHVQTLDMSKQQGLLVEIEWDEQNVRPKSVKLTMTKPNSESFGGSIQATDWAQSNGLTYSGTVDFASSPIRLTGWIKTLDRVSEDEVDRVASPPSSTQPDAVRGKLRVHHINDYTGAEPKYLVLSNENETPTDAGHPVEAAHRLRAIGWWLLGSLSVGLVALALWRRTLAKDRAETSVRLKS